MSWSKVKASDERLKIKYPSPDEYQQPTLTFSFQKYSFTWIILCPALKYNPQDQRQTPLETFS